MHTAISYWVKLRAKVHRMHPFRVKENRREIRSCPVSESDYEFLRANPEHPLMRKTCVFPIDGSEYSAAQASAPDSAELETQLRSNNCGSKFKDSNLPKTEEKIRIKIKKTKRPIETTITATQKQFLEEKQRNQIT